jgi:DNA adenine methylase
LTSSSVTAIVDFVTYPGGKGGAGVKEKIICLMPPHDIYIEPFLGSGAVLRAKRPARSLNVGIDESRESLELVRAAARVTTGEAGSLIATTDEWIHPACSLAQSGDSAGGLDAPDDAHRRTSSQLALLQGDCVRWLDANRDLLTPCTLLYCDPPYVRSSRRSIRDLYGAYEMTDAAHIDLLNLLLSLPCMVMISGYYSVLYADMLQHWTVETFHTTVRSGARSTEYVWMNYAHPTMLHDYRYLGKDFRERERIKRKVTRWKGKLDKMPILERQALLWAMSQTLVDASAAE